MPYYCDNTVNTNLYYFCRSGENSVGLANLNDLVWGLLSVKGETRSIIAHLHSTGIVRAQPRFRLSTFQLLAEQVVLSDHQLTVQLLVMSNLWNSGKDVSEQTKNPRDLLTQSVISIAFGLSAFLTFCVRLP